MYLLMDLACSISLVSMYCRFIVLILFKEHTVKCKRNNMVLSAEMRTGAHWSFYPQRLLQDFSAPPSPINPFSSLEMPRLLSRPM